MTSAVAGICRLVAILILSAGMVKASCATDGRDETHSVSQVPVSDAAVDSPLKDQPAEVQAIKPSTGKTVDWPQQSITTAAAAHGLPLAFFTRLIWQESRFNPRAVSHAGAQGIAQFMPNTARWRGLDDPFEPSQALFESARWLRELRAQFGTLGLAAAAYHAGPARVRRWLSGRATLPSETRAYVHIVTGKVVEAWRECLPGQATDPDWTNTCPDVPKVAARSATIPSVTTEAASVSTWGLQLVGDRSEARALSTYHSLQARFPAILGNRKPVVLGGRLPGRGSWTWYRVRVAEATRERATELCARLQRAGGHCLVLRN